MTLYFYSSLFLTLIIFFVVVEKKKIKVKRDNIYVFLASVLTLIASFRWGVGGDWSSYLATYELDNYTLQNLRWSFFFKFLNLLFSYFGTGIFGVNLFVASMFFFALYRIGTTLKFDIILLILICFSLIYFNGIMGYVRQTLCLSFIMLSFDYLLRKKPNLSTLFFLFAVTTHVTTLVFAPIFIILQIKNFHRLIICLILIAFITFTASDLLIITFNEFVNKERFSAGSIYRSLPLILCCIVYLLFRKKIITNSKDFNFVLDYLLILSIFLILIIFFIPKISALADRFSFYSIIFQIYVIGTFFSKIIKNNSKIYMHSVIFVSISYFLITYAWFIFGDYSVYWLDYKFYIQ